MKRIALLLVFFIPIVAFSQLPSVIGLTPMAAKGYRYKWITSDSGIISYAPIWATHPPDFDSSNRLATTAWVKSYGTTPTLQSVLNAGNTSTNKSILINGTTSDVGLQVTGDLGATGELKTISGGNEARLDLTNSNNEKISITPQYFIKQNSSNGFLFQGGKITNNYYHYPTSSLDYTQKQYVDSISNVISNGAIKNQTASPQNAGFNISGKAIIGTGGTVEGGDVVTQVRGGLLSLAKANTDYAAQKGGLYYNELNDKYRINDGTWKNVATEEFAKSVVVTGKVIYVDGANTNATDTRTGFSKYSLTVPFKTINAALLVCMPGDIINVQPGTYTENVIIDPNGYGGQISTTIILTDAKIDGWVKTMNTNGHQLTLFGIGSKCEITGEVKHTYGSDTRLIENIKVGAVYPNATNDFLLRHVETTIKGSFVRFNLIDCKIELDSNISSPYFIDASSKATNSEIIFPVQYNYSFNSEGHVEFNNCKITFNGTGGFNNGRNTSTIVFKNCSISFKQYLYSSENAGHNERIVFSNCILIGESTSSTIILGTDANTKVEYINTSRNCSNGKTPYININNNYEPNLTIF